MTRGTGACLRAAAVGVAVGLCAMFAAATYSMSAVTDPDRGWPSMRAGGVLSLGVAAGVVASVYVLWRSQARGRR